jgi:hypothetical protein
MMSERLQIVQQDDRILGNAYLFPRAYPWLDSKLFTRTPELLRNINKSATLSSCEVRQAYFGVENPTVEEGKDLGALGVFATRNIKKGELVLLDKTIMTATHILPSRLEHCDACNAILTPPYMASHQVIKPTCCNKVAFCSQSCHDLATDGYHRILCSKDFDWLYKDIKFETKHKIWRRWKAINFLRTVAIIISDNKKLPVGKKWHPLAHPLVARMTAAYPTHGTSDPTQPYEWIMAEDVTIPTKILLQFGVDIFTSDYSQEVIQTMLWRADNNANMSKNGLIPGQDIRTVSINPHYIFLNHSCEPNIDWHASVPDCHVSVKHLQGFDGEMLRSGESAVWCYAARDVKKDEELKISYIGDPLGDENEQREGKRALLDKWFENGCGCRICERENGTSKAS